MDTGGLMIARIWHGVTEAKKSEEYLDYLEETGVPDYWATQGSRGVYVLCRTVGDRAHFLTLSFWDSIDDVKRFAGPDPDRAKYYPADEQFLLDFEPTVEHYEVAVGPEREI
jgi:heme-degrading monooxygenase HmoA